MRPTVVPAFLAALTLLAPGVSSQETAPVPAGATPAVAVLDVPWVWRHWREYVDIIDYVERIKQLDRRDLEEMRDDALEKATEADERLNAGELLERDYRIQKAAIQARLRKLQNYWEIREEIIEKRLADDEQSRLERMQEVVDDIGISGTPFIVKGRAAAFYDEDLELAPRISVILNDIDRREAERAAEAEEAARVLRPSATGETEAGAGEPGAGAPAAEGPAPEEPAAESSPGSENPETGDAGPAPKSAAESAAGEAGSATDE